MVQFLIRNKSALGTRYKQSKFKEKIYL